MGEERFTLAGFTGAIDPRYRPAGSALEREISRLTDPGVALKTIHWGRNYLYLTRFEAPEGPIEVVVKQFRNHGWRRRLERRFRGSKAERSWRVARRLREAGFATPEPVLVLESDAPDGPSFYVCRHLPAAIEARYLFRAANAGELAGKFPAVDFPAFVALLGHTVRRLHDAGFWHRDLSGGNVLLPEDQAAAPRDLYLLDLNRTRCDRRLTLRQRSRDLCRLALFRPEHQRLLLDAYWGAGQGGGLRRRLYLFYHHGFRWKNEIKPRLRGAWSRIAAPFLPRRAHPHIPAAPEGAAARDKVVWDALSDQPHQHASRLEKLAVRLSDFPAHAVETAVVAGALPRIWRRYRALRKELAGERPPLPWPGLGLCVRPWPAAPDQLLGLIEESGASSILLRLHPWQDDHREEEELARELHARGYELTFTLPQNRDLVKDPARWEAAIEELAGRFLPYGRRFQIGQAINRSKWGIWNLGEYVRLAAAAGAILRSRGDVELAGPAVIDFEHLVTAAVLNLKREGLRFDAVASLLYVDRRGAPENPQAGFDTVGKVALLKAIADTSRNAPSGRCWITEVNWPLREGPHSPAGRSVAVDETAQADYLARYYLLALGTGYVERVFWWQLIARGYGLVDPGEGGLRRRPAFETFRHLARELAGSRLLGILPAPPEARLYRFERPDGSQVVAGWSLGGKVSVEMPRGLISVEPSVRYFS